MNSVQLIGRLTHHPEPHETLNGTPLTTLPLAVDHPRPVHHCARHERAPSLRIPPLDWMMLPWETWDRGAEMDRWEECPRDARGS